MNYPPALPRSGLPAPRFLRAGLPVSVSEFIPEGTGIPDSAGDFTLQAVRSVPLLPQRHSGHTTDARVLLRSNIGRIVVSILLPNTATGVVSVLICFVSEAMTGDVSPPYSLGLPASAPEARRSLRKGHCRPAQPVNGTIYGYIRARIGNSQCACDQRKPTTESVRRRLAAAHLADGTD